MMTPFTRLALPAVLISTTLMACAPLSGAKPAPTQTVTNSYSTLSYTLASRLSAVIVGRAYDANGKVGICSASATYNSGTGFKDQLVQKMRDRVVFRLGGDRMLTGAQFGGSYQIDELSDIVGKPTQCVVTDNPWKSEYANEKVDLKANISKIGS